MSLLCYCYVVAMCMVTSTAQSWSKIVRVSFSNLSKNSFCFARCIRSSFAPTLYVAILVVATVAQRAACPCVGARDCHELPAPELDNGGGARDCQELDAPELGNGGGTGAGIADQHHANGQS